MVERNWEPRLGIFAAAVTVLLLAWAVTQPRPEYRHVHAVVTVLWSTAALLAAVFGVVSAFRLRNSRSGRTLALLMSLLAISLAGVLAAPLPYGLGIITLVAFWGVVGATLRLSEYLAGIAKVSELEVAREHTMLANLVRPGFTVWSMSHASVIWWVCLILWVALYGISWLFDRGGTSINVPSLVLSALMPIATLLLFGAALSNVASQAGGIEDREWRSVRWLVWGFVTAAVFAVGSGLDLLTIMLETPILDHLGTFLWAAAPMVLVLGVLLAVIGFGLVDPSFALRRTISVALVGLVWIAVFAATEELLARTVSDRLHLSETAVSWLIVVATAALLAPIQRALERRFGLSESETSEKADRGNA